MRTVDVVGDGDDADAAETFWRRARSDVYLHACLAFCVPRTRVGAIYVDAIGFSIYFIRV